MICAGAAAQLPMARNDGNSGMVASHHAQAMKPQCMLSGVMAGAAGVLGGGGVLSCRGKVHV